jgi:hypothetical protein
MTITTSVVDNTTPTRNELIHDIRESLGMSTYGTAATISSERPRRTVATLEILSLDELTAILKLSRKAIEFSALEPGAARREPGETFVGEDAYLIRDRLYENQIGDLLILADAVDMIPLGVSFRDRLVVIQQVIDEMFDLSTAELTSAHLIVGRQTMTYGKYDPQLMLLVDKHPDKSETILKLFSSKGNRVPTHRDVMTHHGVASAMYDGVL